jgi:hypothetical protein
MSPNNKIASAPKMDATMIDLVGADGFTKTLVVSSEHRALPASFNPSAIHTLSSYDPARVKRPDGIIATSLFELRSGLKSGAEKFEANSAEIMGSEILIGNPSESTA